MRFINKALNGRSPMLIDPVIAKQYAVDAEKFGFTDLIAQVFGEMPKPYKVGGYGIVPIVGPIGKGLTPFERMTGASDLNLVSDRLMRSSLTVKCKLLFSISTHPVAL
jgi:hypothetical protein